jgi:hypothetical protein
MCHWSFTDETPGASPGKQRTGAENEESGEKYGRHTAQAFHR